MIKTREKSLIKINKYGLKKLKLYDTYVAISNTEYNSCNA